MSYTIPNCYTTRGQPIVVNSKTDVIKPYEIEGRQLPSPAQAAANVVKAIATIPTSNAGII